MLVATQTRPDIPAVVEEIKDLLRGPGITSSHLKKTTSRSARWKTSPRPSRARAARLMFMLMGIASISLFGRRHRHHEHPPRLGNGTDGGNRPAHGGGAQKHARGHILLQFLVEAVIMTAIGGAVGVAARIGIARLLTTSDWLADDHQDMPAVIAAFLFSLIVGIFFGLYPANKASKLNPIEALHYQ